MRGRVIGASESERGARECHWVSRTSEKRSRVNGGGTDGDANGECGDNGDA